MILTALLLQATAAATSAQASLDCDNATTQREMNRCAAREFEAADRELNAIYNRAAAQMKQLDEETEHRDGRRGYFQTLLNAQRAWIAFRDAHCTSYGYLARGGSMEPMLVAGCKAQLTRERTAQLRELMDWPG